MGRSNGLKKKAKQNLGGVVTAGVHGRPLTYTKEKKIMGRTEQALKTKIDKRCLALGEKKTPKRQWC